MAKKRPGEKHLVVVRARLSFAETPACGSIAPDAPAYRSWTQSLAHAPAFGMVSVSERVSGKTIASHAPREAVALGAPMRLRARALLAVPFIIALPALFVGVMRASEAAETTKTFVAAQGVADGLRDLELKLAEARTSLWHLEAEPGADVVRRVRVALDDVARSALATEAQLRIALKDPTLTARVQQWTDPGDGAALLPAKNPLGRIGGAIGRLRREVDPILALLPTEAAAAAPSKKKRKPKAAFKPDATGLRRARAALDSARRDVRRVRQNAEAVTTERLDVAKGALSNAGRDQLVLFLLVLFAAPLVIGFGPGFILSPLARLRAAVLKIQAGRIRELHAAGDDEIAGLTDSLGKALKSLSIRDHKKTAKIFEMRKLLRSVLHLVDEPVLVLGRHDIIDYANDAASVLFGDDCHHLEKQNIEDVCFSPVLTETLEKARKGDADDEGVEVTLEGADGRVHTRRMVAGPIVDSDGRIARVVMVFH